MPEYTLEHPTAIFCSWERDFFLYTGWRELSRYGFDPDLLDLDYQDWSPDRYYREWIHVRTPFTTIHREG